MAIATLFALALLLLPWQAHGWSSSSRLRDARATRMSVVDFWKNETHGDGLNLVVAHGINSWPALVEQLQEPFLNNSMLLEGDVFLQNHRRPRHRAIPVMSPSVRAADRVTFKEWLREVANLRKAIKINFRTTEVVNPVLEYLHAAQFDPSSPVLDYPLILHADVFRSHRSVEAPVDPATFVRKTEHLFPDATLSLGWTKQANFSGLEDRYKKMSWRQLMHILEYVARLEQPVMLSVRLTVAARSKEQLLWLLGMDRQLSLLIWSDDHDELEDWTPIFELRRMATKNRVLYDLLDKHRAILQGAAADPVPVPPTFELNAWRAVVFSSASAELSTVVLSERGPAFLGQPTALLLSHSPPQTAPGQQTVEGRVHFLPRHRSSSSSSYDGEDEAGLVVYLIDRLHDIQSPNVDDAIEVFIGHNGRVSIESKAKRHVSKGHKRDKRPKINFEQKAIGQSSRSPCYDFRVVDSGWKVVVEVRPVSCSSSSPSSIPSFGILPLPTLAELVDLAEWRDEGPPTTYIQLDTPMHKSRVLRSVAVAKKGDESVDFLLERLSHSLASLSSFSLSLPLLLASWLLF